MIFFFPERTVALVPPARVSTVGSLVALRERCGQAGQACWSSVMGVPGSQHRAGGPAAVQRGGRRGADAGLADRGGGRGSWRSGAAGPEGGGPVRGGLVSRRPGPRSVLDAWVRVAAVVPPAGKDPCVRWCRAPGPRDRGSAVAGGMVAAVGGVPGPGLGGNDHGGFRSQFEQQVFEKLVGTAGFEPATP
jgi:hypothetical protein